MHARIVQDKRMVRNKLAHIAFGPSYWKGLRDMYSASHCVKKLLVKPEGEECTSSFMNVLAEVCKTPPNRRPMQCHLDHASVLTKADAWGSTRLLCDLNPRRPDQLQLGLSIMKALVRTADTLDLSTLIGVARSKFDDMLVQWLAGFQCKRSFETGLEVSYPRLTQWLKLNKATWPLVLPQTAVKEIMDLNGEASWSDAKVPLRQLLASGNLGKRLFAHVAKDVIEADLQIELHSWQTKQRREVQACYRGIQFPVHVTCYEQWTHWIIAAIVREVATDEGTLMALPTELEGLASKPTEESARMARRRLLRSV
eukprot:6491461-Amphidinium_carterae.3